MKVKFADLKPGHYWVWIGDKWELIECPQSSTALIGLQLVGPIREPMLWEVDQAIEVVA